MKAKRSKAAALCGALVVVACCAARADAQLIGNLDFSHGVGADNDFPPNGHSVVTPATTTSTPYEATISANDGTGAYVTATYNISDNGSVAVFSIAAQGNVTANGNLFAEGGNEKDTTFNLLQASSYVATISSTGMSGADCTIDNGFAEQFYIASSTSFPTQTASGVMLSGPITFSEGWGLTGGYNDSPKPADESGTYSLTLTFTAIPEPSSAALAAIPAVALLLRRRRVPLAG